jgi:hypothetical protein
MRVIDMAQKTTVFFGILFTMEAARHTSSSYIPYLFGGDRNGLTMDFLEENLAIRRGSPVQFALQLVVSIAISTGMLEYASGVL